MIPKRHTSGTHRARTPEATLEAIRPHLRALGVTRCADITRLDRVGIPTYCAVRPEGVLVHVTNGKGLRPVDAQVSALMEAIELFHAENPTRTDARASARALAAAGASVLPPPRIQGFRADRGYDEDRVIDWVAGQNVVDGSPVLVPRAAVYCAPPALFHWTTNGLASGNHRTEAQLHAMLEVIERHALSGLCANGEIAFGSCGVVDRASIADEAVRSLFDRVGAAGLALVLLAVPTRLPVHAFMAALLDPEPFGEVAQITFGYGAHGSPSVAATRAITEAAQVRLSLIHGARNDLRDEFYRDAPARAQVYGFFRQLAPNTSWASLEDHSSDDLERDHRRVVEALYAAGHGVSVVELTRPGLPIAVVRVFVEGTQRTFPL